MKLRLRSFTILMFATGTFFVASSHATQSNSAGEHPPDYLCAKANQEAMIAVTVTDSKGNPALDLKADNFDLSAEGKSLTITSMQLSDTPACIGLILDRSGSMRSKSTIPAAALMEFVKASNPADQFFVVNFNDDPFLDQDFTNDVSLLQSAFARRDPKGGTALYDAVIVSSDHLMKGAGCKRRILIALTDGSDNDSQRSLTQAAGFLGRMPDLKFYLVAISGENSNAYIWHHAFETLVAPVHGQALFIDLKKLENTFHEIAVTMRNEYLITYKPVGSSCPDSRSITVTAQNHEHKNLHVWLRPAVNAATPATANGSSKQ